jgi:hypothetical protein
MNELGEIYERLTTEETQSLFIILGELLTTYNSVDGDIDHYLGSWGLIKKESSPRAMYYDLVGKDVLKCDSKHSWLFYLTKDGIIIANDMRKMYRL